ncbi:hypothetical protein AB0M39_41380 [Streptomyces sp. NPDC051907]|uniref:hypothetical protein n=1 Tax=Streptomyces sp. NPDC051907 TaxID=3155284 RepID=UPI003432645E
MTAHHYLSTACLHGDGAYCRSHTGQSGLKTPAQCKFCAVPCVCACHLNPESPCSAPPEPLVADLRREMDKALGVLLEAGEYLTLHAQMNAALHCASDRVMYSPLHAKVTAAIHALHTTLDRAAPADEAGD